MVDVTVMETEQLLLTGSDAPVRLIEVALAAALNVPPPQVLVALGEFVTCIPEGNESVNCTPLCPTVLPEGLLMVTVSVEVPFTGMLVGLNALVMVGADTAFKVA